MTFTYSGSAPVVGELYTITLLDTVTGILTQVGAGDVTNLAATFCFTYGNKEYLLASEKVFFSEIGEPTKWNNPNGIGNGNVTMTDQFSTPENLVAIAPYQGRLAFFSRQTTQIWQVDADPANWAQLQVMQNIGCVAPLSVQPLGNLDVLFLSDGGVRSLRARDSSLNAYVDDVGSPIDSYVATLVDAAFTGVTVVYTTGVFTDVAHGLAEGAAVEFKAGTLPGGLAENTTYFVRDVTDDTFKIASYPEGLALVFTVSNGASIMYRKSLGGACAIVEPVSGQYWLYFDGVIYALSYYPSAKVQAWSKLLPTLGASQATAFVPSKFTVWRGRVYCRAVDNLGDPYIICYGDPDGGSASYDDAVVTAELPWMALKTPGTRKTAEGLSVAITGAWTFKGCMDPQSAPIYETITSITGTSFDINRIAWTAQGTHLKIQAITTGSTAAVLSSLLVNYEQNEEM